MCTLFKCVQIIFKVSFLICGSTAIFSWFGSVLQIENILSGVGLKRIVLKSCHHGVYEHIVLFSLPVLFLSLFFVCGNSHERVCVCVLEQECDSVDRCQYTCILWRSRCLSADSFTWESPWCAHTHTHRHAPCLPPAFIHQCQPELYVGPLLMLLCYSWITGVLWITRTFQNKDINNTKQTKNPKLIFLPANTNFSHADLLVPIYLIIFSQQNLACSWQPLKFLWKLIVYKFVVKTNCTQHLLPAEQAVIVRLSRSNTATAAKEGRWPCTKKNCWRNWASLKW